MIKAILFDADGVTLEKKGYFSDRFAKDYNLPTELVASFFKEKFDACQRGQADLKQEIQPYLEKWDWQRSVDDFLIYWFASDFTEEHQILTKIDELRSRGIKCFLVSNQEKYRATYFKNSREFSSHFDGFFFSCEIGHLKKEKEFFTEVLKKLDIPGEEIMYFDNEEKNIKAAAELRIESYIFGSFQNFIKIIKDKNLIN
ncbi:MAG TPA: HAD family hydrolase [Verrucomicrobiae bacterium]|nr:HAD family hydrolase [Verrucomicrobiae bacterium]